MDYLALGLYGVISFIIGASVSVFALWKMKKDLFFEEIIENLVIDFGKDDKLLQSVYEIGGTLGSGVKAGIGLDLPMKNRGGKFKWQDAVLDLATQFIGNKIATGSPPLGTPPLQASQGQTLVRDKFFTG
jgi:hypothetical protein